MAKVYDFKLADDECLDFAFEATIKGDTKKALRYVRKVLESNPDNIEANFYLASIYSDLNAFEFSNNVIFKVLPKVKDREEKDKYLILLGANLSALGEFELATYYASQINMDSSLMEDIGDAFDIEIVDNSSSGFYLAYPRGEDYYLNLLDIAKNYLKDKKIDEALKIVDMIDKNNPLIETADRLRLLCYMMRDDFDSAIYFAKEAINRGEKNLSVKCMLITALILENKNEEAEGIIKEIVETEYDTTEDLSVLLPFFVNLNMHNQIVKYSKKVLAKLKYHPQSLMWLSQGYFNLNQKDEAIKVMKIVYEIYKDNLPAQFYIKYYNSGAKTVEYSSSLPFDEILNRQKIVNDFLKMSPEEAKKKFLYDKDFAEIIRWLFKEGNTAVVVAIVLKMSEFYTQEMDSYFTSLLLSDRLTFPILVEILRIYFMNKGEAKFWCYANGIIKDVNVTFPAIIKYMPSNFIVAVANVACEFIIRSEDNEVDFYKLRSFMEKSLREENGKFYFNEMEGVKLSKLKSLKTIAGVIIYETSNIAKEKILERYDITKTIFTKYYKMLIGDKDGREE